MKTSSIIGQTRAVSLIRSALERKKIHHAWLLTGPSGVGKETAARAFAASLLCHAGGHAGGGEPVVDACGICSSCQKLARGVHPDLVELLPEAEAVARKRIAREDLPRTPSRELKIDQVRRLQASLSMAPLEGPRRVVLLIGADTLNQASQNAFLKTLEEPPAGTHLILLAEAGDSLLATTRSRCVRVPFVPLPDDLVAQELARELGLDEEAASLRAALAGGSLGRALSLEQEAIEERARILESVEALGPENLTPLLKLGEELGAKGREECERLLELIALFYRDVALAAEGVDVGALANRDLGVLLRAAAGRGVPDALRRHGLVREALGAIQRHGIARLAVERMLFCFVSPELAA